MGASGTGVVYTTGRYPNIRFGRVTAQMSCGTTWANQIQTGVHMIQKDAYTVRSPGFSTFASYIFNVMNITGSAKYPSHSQLAGVTASQHHNKLHGTDHIADGSSWGTNAIRGVGGISYGVRAGLYTNGALYVYMGFHLCRSGNYGKNWVVLHNFTPAVGGA